jgi:hypothetical protein
MHRRLQSQTTSVRQVAAHEAGVVIRLGPGETVDAVVTRCVQCLWPGEASW